MDVISNQIRRVLQVQKESGQLTSKATSTKISLLMSQFGFLLVKREKRERPKLKNKKITGGGGGGGGGKEKKV